MKNIIIRSILAGVAISIGGIIYALLHDDYYIVSAALFSVGILLVLEFNLYLFTSYVPKNRVNFSFFKYSLNCLIVFLGNFVGCALTAVFMMGTRIYSTLDEVITHALEVKMSDTYLGLFLFSILCGIIIACISKAKTYKNNVLFIVILITTFIVCGFDHVVANSFYLIVTGEILSLSAIPFILINLLGNFVGGYIFSFIDYIHAEEKISAEELVRKQDYDHKY